MQRVCVCVCKIALVHYDEPQTRLFLLLLFSTSVVREL